MSDPILIWHVYLVTGLYGRIRYRETTLRRGDSDSCAVVRCRASELSAHVPDGAVAIHTGGP